MKPNNKEVYIILRVTREFKDAQLLKARQYGKKLSEYVRLMLERK